LLHLTYYPLLNYSKGHYSYYGRIVSILLPLEYDLGNMSVLMMGVADRLTGRL